MIWILALGYFVCSLFNLAIMLVAAAVHRNSPKDVMVIAVASGPFGTAAIVFWLFMYAFLAFRQRRLERSIICTPPNLSYQTC
jgi:Mn2+/Fe2+ NRAMP family transporter